MDGPPKQLAVGSLVDDYEFVLSSFKNADQQLPIMFMHIAPLLQALWQAVPNYASRLILNLPSPGGRAREAATQT